MNGYGGERRAGRKRRRREEGGLDISSGLEESKMDWKRGPGWFKPGHFTRRYHPGSLLLLGKVSAAGLMTGF
jgi:hypothetical protein